MAKDRAFRLVKELSPVTVQMHASTPGLWEVVPGDIGYEETGGWTALASGAFYWRGTIDLRGVTASDRTLFFASNIYQRPLPYRNGVDMSALTMLGFTVMDQMIVSDVPLDDPAATSSPWSQTAGFADSRDDFMEVKLAQGFLCSSNTNTPSALPIVDTWSFGSNDPTATNKLYLYRWFNIFTGIGTVFNPGEQIAIPPYRYVGTGISTNEPDLEWLMRLKRSFEV